MVASAREAGAICGIVTTYGVTTPAVPNGFAVLYSPIFDPALPGFPVTGIAFVPLGGVFGDAVYQTIVAAGSSVPADFMTILDSPPPAPPSQCFTCVTAPGFIVFSICPGPIYAGVFN